jgi:hypothetical protein
LAWDPLQLTVDYNATKEEKIAALKGAFAPSTAGREARADAAPVFV